MRIGFTGTQQGMSARQMDVLDALLQDIKMDGHTLSVEFHHGDCIGADEQAHRIAEMHGLYRIIHPPLDNSRRAWCKDAALVHEPRAYLDRNRDIVRASEILIATPAQEREMIRSGTWSTVRYARKLRRVRYIVMPNGYLKREA